MKSNPNLLTRFRARVRPTAIPARIALATDERRGVGAPRKRRPTGSIAVPASVLALCFFLLLGFPKAHAAAATPATNGFWFLELSKFALRGEAPAARSFSALPKGLQFFHAVPFRAELPMAVTGVDSARNGDFFPPSILGIPVGKPLRRIHLLHATTYADKDGAPLARIVFHYANGGEESVRLGYGVHSRAWVAPRLEKRSELLDPNSIEAWSEADERRGTGLRLFQTALENPRPAEVITRIDIVSLFSHAAPFFAGITIEGSDSTLAPQRPASTRKPVRDLHAFRDSVYRGELSVRVIDGDTGAPPTNALASLSITDDRESFYFGDATPDAQGVARFPFPPLHAVGVNIWMRAPDRLPVVIAESTTNVARLARDYSATLRRGNTIGGIIKSSAGNSISNAQVIIYRVTRLSPHHYTRTDYDMATSGADGRWTSHCLPADLAGFNFQIDHPDYRTALYVTAGSAPPPVESVITTTSTSVSYRRLPDGTLEPITTRRLSTGRGGGTPLLTSNALLAASAEMVLQPAMLLQGTLADAAGKILPGRELILQRSGGERKYLRTDERGHFETRAGEPGDAALIVLLDGFTPLWRSLNIVPNMTPVDLKLAPARVLRGRVQDRNARPVEGARARVDDWNGTSDLLKFQALTDEQGSFVWTGAPSDQVTFYVSKTNYSNTRHSVAGATGTFTIPISQPPGVYGKVIDAETKKPIESFVVIPGRKYSQGETQIHWDRSESTRGAGGEYSLRMNTYYFQPEGRVLVEAPGYEPQVSRGFAGVDSYANDFALKPGKGVSGIVRLPDGSPAAGATLVVIEKGESGFLDPSGQVRGNGGSGDLARTDLQGRFEFMPKLEPDKLFVSHEQGFGQAKVSDVLGGASITLQKWGRLKGVIRVGDKPTPSDATVRLQNNFDMVQEGDGRGASFGFSLRADPASDGSFIFEKVPPGEHRIALEYHFKDDRNGDLPLSHGMLVDIKPGATAEATLGGTGRRIAGRVKVVGGETSDVDWRRDVHRLTLMLPQKPGAGPRNGNAGIPQPATLLTFLGGLNPAPAPPMSIEKIRERQRAERNYVLLFDTNGTFHADNVPPGKYLLELNATDPEEEYYNRRSIGALNKEIIVPDEKSAKVNAPFDIGELKMTIRARVKVGKAVPPFEAKTREGKAIKLSDYRGKPLLVHFWGLSLGYSSYDLQVLKGFQTTYGGSGKLAILGCNLDANAQGAEQFAKTQGMTWTQTYLGDWSQTPIPGMFGINGNSACVLIDPEGKLLTGQLRGTAIRNAVENAMSTE